MKKLLSLILVMAMSVMLVSCLEIEKKKDNKDMLNIVEPVDMGERVIDISEGITEDGSQFSYSCDLDYDGKDENITMQTSYVDEYKQLLELKVGDKTAQLEMFDGYIEKVYSCDIDENDDARDIAIITNEVSSDPRIRILSYENELLPYEFSNKDGYSEEEASDSNWLGYACSYYFNINDDSTITLEKQTGSEGMWSVLRKYERNEDGVFEEIPYEKYKILDDFMSRREPYGENITDEEKEMWKRGYIKAYIPYSNESITLVEGEYFKPMYDNDNNRLYIEKETGETGYIDIGYENFYNHYELNQSFFMVAG